jgi:hypothetical protein
MSFGIHLLNIWPVTTECQRVRVQHQHRNQRSDGSVRRRRRILKSRQPQAKDRIPQSEGSGPTPSERGRICFSLRPRSRLRVIGPLHIHLSWPTDIRKIPLKLPAPVQGRRVGLFNLRPPVSLPVLRGLSMKTMTMKALSKP